jgi:mRNA-degrading endonuclease toxin of MazEF toxin-antitoxin module
MKRGDIYLVDLEPTRCREQQGQRPVIVLSATGFNNLTGLPAVCPITNGGNFARTAGFAVPLQGFGLTTSGVVRCDQMRVVDLKARHGKLVEAAPPVIVTECLEIVQTIFT